MVTIRTCTSSESWKRLSNHKNFLHWDRLIRFSAEALIRFSLIRFSLIQTGWADFEPISNSDPVWVWSGLADFEPINDPVWIWSGLSLIRFRISQTGWADLSRSKQEREFFKLDEPIIGVADHWLTSCGNPIVNVFRHLLTFFSGRAYGHQRATTFLFLRVVS